MLTTLRIKNLALVSDLTLELQPGYNVVTGETGAGKSILIGALNLVLGERADRSLIRSGSDACLVEAVFEVGQVRAPLQSFLEAHGLEPCEDGLLVLKRTFTAAGANRQFVNGSPATLQALATIGEWLVDIHGPHDHQSLLHPARQLDILDAFGGLHPQRDAFAALVRRRAALVAEKTTLVVDEKTYAQQLDLLRFQTCEISSAALLPGEDERIEQEHQRAGNAAKLLQLSQAAVDLLSENENSLLTQAGVVGRALQELQRIDTGATEMTSLHGQAVDTLRELQARLGRYAEQVDLDPDRLRQLEARLDLIHSLKRKYGASVAEIVAFGEEAARQLHSLEQRDEELARLNAEQARLDEKICQAGGELSRERRKIIPRLAKAVGKQLADLGFKQSAFEAAIATRESGAPNGGARVADHVPEISPRGFDTIEFQFAPNPGEPPRPLRSIASSGELARVMLALKTVLAAEDEIPVLVFDEVDANVGGETANAVGEKMRQLAARRQVLCITHLPQVAATATAHYVAAKQVKGGRTISEINLLDPEERVTELTRMLGGQTAAARKHAEALLKA